LPRSAAGRGHVSSFKPDIERIDHRISTWMREHATGMLRVSLAIVFIWFGALKVWRGSTSSRIWC
jgi:hypothetical protein